MNIVPPKRNDSLRFLALALFVDVEVYGKAGEALAQHKAKGEFLLVDDRLRLNTWERDGQRHSRLVVVADQVSFGPNTKGVAGGTPAAEGEDKDDLPF